MKIGDLKQVAPHNELWIFGNNGYYLNQNDLFIILEINDYIIKILSRKGCAYTSKECVELATLLKYIFVL
jgi:hypothetical protein